MALELAQLRFGALEIGFPAVFAALAGYTDRPTRLIARRLGAPFTITEAMLARFVLDVTKGAKARRLLRVDDELHPCGAQLMGSTGEDLPAAACRLAELGYDAVDVNLACPVRKVVGKRRGGWLLGHPEEAIGIVARVRDALPPEVPLTVKMRRGFDDEPASGERFFAILDGVFAAGAEAVTVHGRTVRQKYAGVSGWGFLRDVKRRAGGRTVLGSGDLFTPGDCLDMLAATGVDAVWIARGAIGNPWIFGQLRDLAAGRPAATPTLDEQRDVIAEHYRLAEETYGPRRACRTMRKFGIKYARLHPRADEVREALVAVRRPDDWRRVLAEWYPGRALPPTA